MSTQPGAPPALSMDAGTHEGTSLLATTEEYVRDQQVVENSFFASALDYIFPLSSCFIVPERVQYVLLQFGRYHSTITDPGCYCRFWPGLDIRGVQTDLQTFEMHNTKIVDSTGSPLIVSGIVTFQIVHARRAAIDVHDVRKFVADQAPAILKRVVSQFPYESKDSNLPSLRSDTAIVANVMRDSLQKRVEVAGVKVDSFSINELSYAPEIAGAMLKRQQAQALLDARREIVKGAKEIAMETVGSIAEDLPPEERAKLLTNILVVLIGEKEVTPTLQV